MLSRNALRPPVLDHDTVDMYLVVKQSHRQLSVHDTAALLFNTMT